MRPHLNPPINAQGRVPFFAEVPLGVAIFSGRGGPHKVHGVSTGPFSFFGFQTSINDRGQVCFRAGLDSGDEGIFISEPSGGVTTIALKSGPLFSAFGTYLLLHGAPPAINQNGLTAFTATLKSGKNGVFTAARSGLVTPIAKSSDTGFERFGNTAMNDEGTVAFAAISPGNSVGIYTGQGGEISTVALSRQDEFYPNPDAPISINSARTVVYNGWGRYFYNGIFSGPDPDADKVIRYPDPLFGGRVDNVEAGYNAVSEAGQIVFRYHLQGHIYGIAVATPVP